MRVYVKRDVRNHKFMSLFAWILLTFIAMGAAMMLFDTFTGEQEYSSTIELILAPIFYLGVLIAYIGMFFKPTRYNLRLVAKKNEEDKGQMITNMSFSGVTNGLLGKHLKQMSCYTVGQNELEIDKNYTVVTSKFDGLPIRIEIN